MNRYAIFDWTGTLVTIVDADNAINAIKTSKEGVHYEKCSEDDDFEVFTELLEHAPPDFGLFHTLDEYSFLLPSNESSREYFR